MRKVVCWAILLGMLMLLAGCGANSNGNAGGNSDGNAGSNAVGNSGNGDSNAGGDGAGSIGDGAGNAGGAAGSADGAGDAVGTSGNGEFPRTIVAANGDVVIEKAPEKVALVHWGYTDSMLVFDLPSLAVVLPFGREHTAMGTDTYKPYVDRLDEWVVVGDNTEVNFEALMAYEPDIIIAGSEMNEANLSQLQQIATTVAINEEEINVWSDWKPLVTKFGEILGQEGQASQFIAEFDGKLAEAKQQLADVQGTVAFLQVRSNAVWLQGSNYLTLYYDGMGLKVPDGEGAADGAQLSLEGLSVLNPDHIVLGYFNYIDPSQAAMTDEWESTEVWKKLKATETGQVHRINGELALAYGPLSHLYGIEAVSEALR